MNLELRKAALEASGKGFIHEFPSDRASAECKHCGHTYFYFSGSHVACSGAAVESDPAVSEPWFLEWCEKNGYEWQMNGCEPHDDYKQRHFVLWIFNNAANIEAEVYGATPSEARARAVIEASKVKQNATTPEAQN